MKITLLKNTVLALTLAASTSACDQFWIEDPGPVPIVIPQPNPLPTTALVKQIKWSENDHRTFTYNAKGQITKLRSQWQYVQNDPTKIRSIEYNFEYDERGKLVKMNYNGGFTVRYVYQDSRVEKVQEFYPGGALQTDYQFIYRSGRIVQINRTVYDRSAEAPSRYKEELFYDPRNNLNKKVISEVLDNGQFKVLETVEYADFDDKLNTLHWTNHYPYLPQVRLQSNNPRRQVTTTGSLPTQTRSFVYTYDTQGRPIIQTELQSKVELTATLHY